MKIQWKFNTVKFELQGEIGELTWPYPPQKIIFNKHSLLNKTVSCYNKTRIGYGLEVFQITICIYYNIKRLAYKQFCNHLNLFENMIVYTPI